MRFGTTFSSSLLILLVWATANFVLSGPVSNSGLKQHLKCCSGLKVTCNAKDDACPQYAENLRNFNKQYMMDSLEVSVEQSDAAPSSSTIHLDRSDEQQKFDYKNPKISLKKALEKLLNNEYVVSLKSYVHATSQLDSIESFQTFLGTVSPRRFFLISSSCAKKVEQTASIIKSVIDAESLIASIDCHNPKSEQLCHLLGLRSEQGTLTLQISSADHSAQTSKTFSAQTCSGDDEVFSKEVNSFLSENKKTYKGYFTMFHAPWCGHCKAAKPSFDEAKDKIDKELPGYRMEAINCEDAEGKKLCQEANVRGYPTFVYSSPDSQDEKKYNGPRDTQSFLAAARANAVPSLPSNTVPITQILSASQLANALTSAESAPKLIVLALQHTMDPHQVLQLIRDSARVAQKHDGQYQFAFAVTGHNSAFDKYLGCNLNYPASIVVLSEGAVRQQTRQLTEWEIVDSVERADFSDFMTQKRDPLVPFKDMELYWALSTAYLSYVDAITEKLKSIHHDTAPIYSLNSVSYIVDSEHIFSLKDMALMDLDTVVTQFREFLAAEVSTSSQDL